MMKSATFKKKYICFEEGERFEFRPGVNLLVGDQGVGKSTLLGLVRELGMSKDPKVKGQKLSDFVDFAAEPIKMFSFDFEKDNPRIKAQFSDDMSMGFQISARFASHGQVARTVIYAMKQADEPTLFVMDEPDGSLSLRSIFMLVKIMKGAAKKGCQMLAAVHNPYVISAFPEVLSMEHRRWMPSDEFIETQKMPMVKKEEPPA